MAPVQHQVPDPGRRLHLGQDLAQGRIQDQNQGLSQTRIRIPGRTRGQILDRAQGEGACRE